MSRASNVGFFLLSFSPGGRGAILLLLEDAVEMGAG